MVIDISTFPLPAIYKRNDQKCYLDPYRQKLIKITPEETIRQRIAVYFEQVLAVPHDMILLEQHMSHYGVSGRDRADITILRFNEQMQEFNPVAIIECKAPSIAVVDSTILQAKHYADALGCDYIFATNGTDMRAYKYLENGNEYKLLHELPKYYDMLDGKAVLAEKEIVPPRTPFSKLSDTEILEQYEYDGFIGKNTKQSLKPHILNLFEGLLDVSQKIAPKQLKYYKIVQDYGIRTLSYGNASGGVFSGPYRSFLIETINGNTEFVGITVSGMQRADSETDTVKTALCVSIDSFDKSHHALQLNFDNGVSVKNEQLILTHSGRITVGHKGSSKASDLIEYIEANYPELVLNGKVFLGTLNCSKLLYVNQPEYEQVIENLILYALARDEYRSR